MFSTYFCWFKGEVLLLIVHFFPVILILVSLRAEVVAIQWLGTDSMKRQLHEDLVRQRGSSPSFLEGVVVIYVLGE